MPGQVNTTSITAVAPKQRAQTARPDEREEAGASPRGSTALAEHPMPRRVAARTGDAHDVGESSTSRAIARTGRAQAAAIAERRGPYAGRTAPGRSVPSASTLPMPEVG